MKITGQPGGIAVVDENDNVVLRLMECLEVIKQYELVLVLGSQSTRERLIITDAAKELGALRRSSRCTSRNLRPSSA